MARKFATALAGWTAGIYAFLALVSLTSPAAGAERVIGLVGWGGIALLLAAAARPSVWALAVSALLAGGVTWVWNRQAEQRDSGTVAL